MGELLPCPFCGGDAVINQIGNEATKTRGYEVKCRTFGCSTSKRSMVVKHTLAKAREWAVERWNTRPRTEGRGEGEPVAWRYRWRDRMYGAMAEWSAEVDHDRAVELAGKGGEVEPLYASPIREPEISGEALIAALSDEVVREVMTDAWSDICEDTGFHPTDIQQLGRKKLMFEPRHWADLTAMLLRARLDAILNLAPVGGRGGEGSSQSQPVVSPKSDMEAYGYNGERPEHDTEWKRGDVEKPVYDGWGERYLLTWCTRTATYDVGCIDGNWTVGEQVETSPGELWRWLDGNPERHLPPPPQEQGGMK